MISFAFLKDHLGFRVSNRLPGAGGWGGGGGMNGKGVAVARVSAV